jgi:hypothetical protein
MKKLFSHMFWYCSTAFILAGCNTKQELTNSQWQLINVQDPGVYNGDVFMFFESDTTLVSRYTSLNKTQREPYLLHEDTLFIGPANRDTLLILKRTSDSLVLQSNAITFHFAAFGQQE